MDKKQIVNFVIDYVLKDLGVNKINWCIEGVEGLIKEGDVAHYCGDSNMIVFYAERFKEATVELIVMETLYWSRIAPQHGICLLPQYRRKLSNLDFLHYENIVYIKSNDALEYVYKSLESINNLLQ